MDTIIQEINNALNRELYYLGVVMALMLPDICAALESSNGETNSALYKDWYNKNLAVKYPNLTANDCYSLRCGVVHQGRLGHSNMQYERVLFTVPNAQNNVFHNNILNKALNLDATIFCRDMTASVSQWFSAAQTTPNVQANLLHLVQFRPRGLSPYMVGIPIIA